MENLLRAREEMVVPVFFNAAASWKRLNSSGLEISSTVVAPLVIYALTCKTRYIFDGGGRECFCAHFAS
jgi:hypothetical protein